jgi:hypothetical protein
MISRAIFLSVLLMTSLWAGCSRNSSEQASPPQSFNLGPVELADGVAGRHELGGGMASVNTAQALNSASIGFTAVLEKAGKNVATTRVVPAPVGIPLEISFGDVRIQLTPLIKPPG